MCSVNCRGIFLPCFSQDDDALAELRGAVGGDEARDAGPDHDHVVLETRLGHHRVFLTPTSDLQRRDDLSLE